MGSFFILIALLGFFNSRLFGNSGFFRTDTLYNVIHLIVGLCIIIVANKGKKVVYTYFIFGFVYLIIAVLGFDQVRNVKIGGSSLTSDVNSADNVLHIILSAIFFILSFLSRTPKVVDRSPVKVLDEEDYIKS